MENASNEDLQKSISSSNDADHLQAKMDSDHLQAKTASDDLQEKIDSDHLQAKIDSDHLEAKMDADHDKDNSVPDILNHGGAEPKLEIDEKEARDILEVIASTGKFWHDWEKLKGILSFQLKQVLSEYPEAKMTTEQQNASLGETFPELEKRLDEALQSFDRGPPFTVQRLCEILLDARGIYPNLSKLALALEKNLLVTSMLIISTEPQLQSTIENPNEPHLQSIIENPNEPGKAVEEPKLHSNSEQNGVEPMVGDRDEVMTEVEDADVEDANMQDDMTIDMEAFGDMVGSSETNTAPTNDNS
ncbi:hypothetical protein UlMin_024752 [Ulmus minor]